MPFERKSFRKPAKSWLWLLLPVWFGLLVASIFEVKTLLYVDHPAAPIKYAFLLFFGLCLMATYLLIGYIYLNWATPLKNKLIELSYSDHRVLIYQYNRYFVNEALLQDKQIAIKPYTRLSQRDLKDVAARIGFESR
ncbi:hypothetical protein [Paenibacillus sp. Y412MC10]|uniref:hypothetical protein n=1 Tax=Geobacillus sp. (strain Y412MC10) TaxID=481743 RepID=UPI0011AB8991|nr:hypothetical protein [Paenibacillus sp. Y412MC10]